MLNDEFIYPVQVPFDDVDRFGVVHHAKFLCYMERARIAWWESMGMRLDQWQKRGILFAIHHIDLEFKKPARQYHHLIVMSRITEQRRVSRVYRQVICAEQDRDFIYCIGTIRVVSIDANMRPCAMPEKMEEML